MDVEEALDILTSLMAENQDGEDGAEPLDDLEALFDEDNEEYEYKDGAEVERRDTKAQEMSNLFGDVDEDEGDDSEAAADQSGASSSRDLQEELQRMQQKMQQLQQQLEASQKASAESPLRPNAPRLTQARPTAVAQRAKTQAVAPPSSPATGARIKLQESSDFSDQLNSAESFKRKSRVAQQPKASTPGDRGPLVEVKLSSSFQPQGGTANTNNPSRSPPSSQNRGASSAAPKIFSPPPPPKDVAMEKYSGLRLRKPRVSSSEMDRKMANRRLIRLSQVPERLAREKLEDSDWVTFAVLVHKATQQSSSSGKTFSIWKLNDLHNLEVFVTLLLFNDVHRELWKTEAGTVMGILNPNPMKQRDGYDGVSLTVDHPQKVLLMGDAQDFGTCKAAKKNGEPCSQIVNLDQCQYCQYHVNAQYKKMSSKRAELQSSFSGKAPNKMRAGGLRERLCQDGFHYGGVSSPACAASLATTKSNKPAQRTLDSLFIRGSAKLVQQAKRLAMESGHVSGCSDEFRNLLSVPTPGALQLKKHLAQPAPTKPSADSPLQSTSASDLLKQQKLKQQEFLQRRRQRADHIQRRVLQNSTRPGSPPSPKAAPEGPKSSRSPDAPHVPTLGRGFAKGEDILFFESGTTPPPPPPPPAASTLSLSAAKLRALKKLKASGGAGLEKEDPNAVKRKRSSDSEINARVEKNRASPSGSCDSDEEPSLKRRREEQRLVESEDFQKILKAKSCHSALLQAAEYQLQEKYFDVLVKKEQMEEKMRGIREMKCRAVSCKKCNYTYFKPADRCVEQKHPLHWHHAVKRFFKCPCGQRAIALDRLPHKHCTNCGLFKWERDGMMKEKAGPKIGGELLLPRGEEHGKFLNSK